MATHQVWTWFSDSLEIEKEQLREENRALTEAFEQEIDAVLAMPDGAEKELRAQRVFEKAQRLPYASYKDVEPSDWEGIAKLAEGAEKKPYDAASLEDRIYGGWLARCAGCLLGKPIEGWRRAMIHDVFTAMDNEPAHTYLSSDIPQAVAEKYADRLNPNCTSYIDRVDGMPEDDDTNYTIIALKLLENAGRDFTSDDVKKVWLTNLPYYHLCTAERVAYRNMVMNIEPPESAVFCNGYREWIGAQIRADLFGYINPGDPVAAANMAWRDARISHVKNGIYGEMWVAAMIAEAFVSDDMKQIIRAGLSVLPSECRLVKAVEQVIGWYDEGADALTVLNRICEIWDENNSHHWCHTISNAMIVATALLYGENDLQKTLGISIMPGFDTDCNGATSASVLGVKLGAKALPESWIAPLKDTLYSGVDGFSKSSIKALAKRTMKFVP